MIRVFYHCLTWTLMLFFSFYRLSPASAQDQTPKLENKVESLLEIFYLNSAFRSPYDKTSVENAAAVIQVWRDLPAEPRAEQIECLGYQWLLTGRGAKMGEGASKVFQEIPSLNSIELKLVDVEFETESIDKRGKLKPKAIVKPYLRMRVTRESLAKSASSSTDLKKLLRENNEECLKWGRAQIAEKEIQF
jgi:hypothetical protein